MSVNLRVTLGTVNYTNWIHVTASKVSTPSVIAWEDWINAPVSNYNFIIPGLDPEIYYIRYYDATTDTALGVLVAELVVNALTGETLYERRFYVCGGAGDYDPADGATDVTDPYLIGKTIEGVFKEAFRYLIKDVEYENDINLGKVSLLGGQQLNQGEVIIIDIKYTVATTVPATTDGLYHGSLNVTEATKTLTVDDANKRIRCVGTISTQVITLEALALMATDAGFYFDNSCGGTAVQVKLLLAGADKIRFNGFATASIEFTEFWVSKGEHVLIRKFDAEYWEIIGDYKGTNVGEKVTLGYSFHPNVLKENGALIDGDEYPRLWWWITNVLPATHKYITDTVVDVGFTHNADRIGQFAVHSSLKKFRMPKTSGMMEKGHTDFDYLGSDSPNRTVDYPGGFQPEQLPQHDHPTSANGNNAYGVYGQEDEANVRIESYQSNKISTKRNKTGGAKNTIAVGSQNRTNNIGVIYGRRI